MIKKVTLKNGLRVLIENIPTVKSVTMGIWVGTGSRYENQENNGISHFIEHMLFKGTKNRSAQEIAEEFDSIGGNVNAFTSKEYTCYYAKVTDEHIETGLDILSDMFFNSLYDEVELERERNVVMEEIRMYEDTPDDQIHDLIARASYQKHPLGYSILGTEDVLKNINRDLMIEYIKDHYTIENTVITLAGNIPDHVTALLEKYFSSFSTHGQHALTKKPTFDADAIIKQKQTEQAHLSFAFPGLSVANQDMYSLILLNNIIGGSMSSRLFQEIREKRGLAYSVFSYHTSFQDNGLFNIYAGTGTHQVDEVTELIQSTIYEIKQKGISEKELIKGKEQLKGNLMLSLESTSSRMSRLGRNELLLGKHLTLDEIVNKINQVNQKSIHQVIDHVFGTTFSFAMISPLQEAPKTLRRDLLG